jgi:hypothetical protein
LCQPQPLAPERPATGAFTTTKREAGDPHHCEHDGRNPQQVNGKARAEKYEYQKSQQDYDHDNSPCSGARDWTRISETNLIDDCLGPIEQSPRLRNLFPQGVLYS